MADPLVVTIPHKLGKDEALRRIKPALGKASSSFPALAVEEEIWSGDSMMFRVRALEGEPAVLGGQHPRVGTEAGESLGPGRLLGRGWVLDAT